MADDTNRGAIWPNRKKEKDTHPDFTGQINVDGKDYWLSAWKKKPDAAERAPSLSLSVKPKDGAARTPDPGPARSMEKRHDMDDEIPF